jgi:hypothetical protein
VLFEAGLALGAHPKKTIPLISFGENQKPVEADAVAST